MEQLNKILKKSNGSYINVNNGNIVNNVNNVNNADDKFALNRKKFTPNTVEAIFAENIATHFSDLKNFAFYFHVINRLGTERTYRLFAKVKDDIRSKEGTKYNVRNPKKYFAWCYKNIKRFSI